jgi:predicted metal-dependent enzyme (double-stranded beta helix superfamily)
MDMARRSFRGGAQYLRGDLMSDSDKPEISFQRRAFVASVAAASTQLILPVSSLASTKQPTSIGSDRMDIERFVEDCVAANHEADAQVAVKEVLARAVSTPNDVLAALGEPSRAGLNVLLNSATLTIFAATWTPQMNLMPHDHLMWANIGIYTGREDNIFWKKSDDGIKAYEAAALFQKDVAALPINAVHSVTNPLQRFTGGIHIYGGDFFDTTRSQWNPETLEEEPSDGAVIRGMFERENERLGLN